jgi:tRNA (cytidine/uridine-2'-O-)-methyltransferase
MHLVLFQPEIPQNVGTLIRFAACLGFPLDIIEPCGFLFTDKHLKRSGMDYMDLATVQRFSSWQAFCEARKECRRVAITPEASMQYVDFSFQSSDLLIMGQESAGFPPEILQDCHERVSIPMVPERRSLNMAISAAIVTTEALRQTHLLPGGSHVS